MRWWRERKKKRERENREESEGEGRVRGKRGCEGWKGGIEKA